MSRYLIIPDVQVPYHNYDKFMKVIEYGVKLNPDTVVIIGDFLDCPAVSTFSKGRIDEFATTLEQEVSQAKELLYTIRSNFPEKNILFHVGNHEERISRYIRTYAPALAGMSSLRVEELLGLQGLGIQVARRYEVFEDTFVTTHGHLGKLHRTAGMTALNAAKSIGLPVVCGHTHSLGIIYSTNGVEYLGTARTVWGMEVGHVMDTRQVTYKKDDVLNWQAGFGYVDVVDGIARPHVIYIG